MKPESRFGSLLAEALWSAAWDLGIAASFLITWIRPETFGERTVHKLVFLMLLEFLVVHSTGFFAAISSQSEKKRSRAFMFTLLLGFYILFSAAFSAMYGGPWPLIAFLLLALPRIPGIVLHPPDEDTQFVMMANWAGMTCLYLGSIFVTLIYEVPALGVTPDVIAAQNFSVGGEWTDQPYRVMACGALYFTGLALLNLLMSLPGLWQARRAQPSG
ncbi:MAG: hypothetical protein GC168_15990 [Candidatus Hydrogenedens sp.]|nr:hypothetical protein [Candidatus Hydrogenedens sp.]